MSRSDLTSTSTSISNTLASSVNNPLHVPSVLTRSMSRKTITSSSTSNVGLLRENNLIRRASSVRSIPTSTSTSTSNSSRTLPSSSSSKGLIGTSRSVVGTAPRRSILCELNDVRPVATNTVGLKSNIVRARPRSSSNVAGMSGMGIRTGPSVLAQRTSPTKMLGESARDSMSLLSRDAGNPFSLDFKSELVVARAVGGSSHKRSFEEDSYSVDENGSRRERKNLDHGSPAKRPHYGSMESKPTQFNNSRSFLLTSPKKSPIKITSTTPKTAPPLSSPRKVYQQTGGDFDSMDVDLPIIHPSHRIDFNYRNVNIPSSSPAPPLFIHKKPRPTSSESSEDEIDFLSPKKKPKPDDFNFVTRPSQPNYFTANSNSSIRSPPKKVPSSPMKSRPSSTATSVPMSRPSFTLPPLPTFNNRRVSTSSNNIPVLAPIDSQLPIPLTVVELASTSTVTASIPSSNSIMATSKTSFAYGPSAGPRKSGIPRPVAISATILPPILPPSPKPIQPPTLPSISKQLPLVNQSIFTSHEPPKVFDSVKINSNMTTTSEGEYTLDQTFNTTLDLDSTMGDISTMSNVSVLNTSVGGMSSETAKRLANLQSMLSKLSMPRQSSGNSSTASTPSSSQESQSSRSGKMLPPMITSGGVGKERRENLGRDRRRQNVASNSREDYEVPISGGSLSSNANLSTTMKRLDTSISRRPSSNYDSSRSIGMGPPPTSSSLNSSSSGGSNNMRPPRRTSVISGSTSTAAISAIAEGELSAKPKSNVLRGVVAFVDVRTLEGDDAGMIFVDMLKSMGARVTTRPTLTLTHIVYKSGRPGTLHRLRAHPDPKPFLVGISWVVRCAEVGMKVDEKNYIVESGNQPIMHKRRRSMEPKAFAALNSSLGSGGTTATDPALKATIAASIERARRKSLQFQPRIGSPLAKRVFLMSAEETDDEEMS